MPTPEVHAMLGASSANRWLHCTPSARLESTLPDSTSDYAKEGTLAHKIAELKVRKKFVEPMSQRTFTTRHNKLKKDPLYDPEMEACTDEYLDYITGIALSYNSRPYITVERELDYSRFVPHGFGTGDCIIIGDDTLHVIDYKHGKGVVVDVEHNPQLMLYGLGALEAYHLLYNIKQVALTIVQPRAQGDTVKEWSIEADKLLDWGVFTVRHLAELADKGEGDFCAGDWCRFCRAKATCRAYSEKYGALADFGGENALNKTGKAPMPPLLSDAEVGQVLQQAVGLEHWVTALKDYALNACLDGKEIPGWKAVAGRRTRVWDDMDKAFADMEAAGVEETMLYERRPLTLAATEKMLGKPRFTEIAGTHVITTTGKPALAPQTDARDPITRGTTAAEDFKGE